MLNVCFVSLTAWDCSAWVRTYALFLEERLECFRVLKYDTEAERLPKSNPGQDKVSCCWFALFSFGVPSSFFFLLIVSGFVYCG